MCPGGFEVVAAANTPVGQRLLEVAFLFYF
jgi:hypothetical protein